MASRFCPSLATLGFLMNPIAGMGGAVGLKGTDGARTLREAIRKGAKPVAPERGKDFLAHLQLSTERFTLLVAPGIMGANLARSVGISHQLVGRVRGRTSALDTRRIAALMKRRKVDLLVFCG